MRLSERRTHRPPAWITVALTTCLILVARPARALISSQLPDPVQDAPGVLVSIEWLAEHLQDSTVALVHVGMPTARSSGEFIPGARFLNYQEIVGVRDSLIAEVPPIDDLIEPLEVAGVSDEALVVLYGSPAHLPARAYMTLDYLGHGARTVVLDGGLEAWKAADMRSPGPRRRARAPCLHRESRTMCSFRPSGSTSGWATPASRSSTHGPKVSIRAESQHGSEDGRVISPARATSPGKILSCLRTTRCYVIFPMSKPNSRMRGPTTERS